jgi:hypothetical protein
MEVEHVRSPSRRLVLRHRRDDGDVLFGVGGVQQRPEAPRPGRHFAWGVRGLMAGRWWGVGEGQGREVRVGAWSGAWGARPRRQAAARRPGRPQQRFPPPPRRPRRTREREQHDAADGRRQRAQHRKHRKVDERLKLTRAQPLGGGAGRAAAGVENRGGRRTRRAGASLLPFPADSLPTAAPHLLRHHSSSSHPCSASHSPLNASSSCDVTWLEPMKRMSIARGPPIAQKVV